MKKRKRNAGSGDYTREISGLAAFSLFVFWPTGNLDSTNRDEIQRLLMDVRERFDQTILMVTHDMSLAESVDRKIVMSDGRVL